MQFKAVSVLALAATASASYGYSNVTYTTEVVTAYTTYCPEATTLTYNGQTYPVTEPTYVTITNCGTGCTVTKPVYVTSSVACNTCVAPTSTPAYVNTTTPGATYPVSPVYPTGTGSGPVGTSTPPAITGGANKAIAVSGAGLAGVLGLAAFLL